MDKLTAEQRKEHMRELFDYAYRNSSKVVGKEQGYADYNANPPCYSMNMSSMLSSLIRRTGVCVERWLSDLFITWKTVEQLIGSIPKTSDEETDYVIFGLRVDGVDHDSYVYHQLDNYRYKPEYIREYYREIYALKLVRTTQSCTAELRDITNTIEYWQFDRPDWRRDLTPLELYRFNKTVTDMGYPAPQSAIVLDGVEANNLYASAASFHYLFAPGCARIDELISKLPEEKQTDVQLKYHSLLSDIEHILHMQERFADTNSLPYIPTDHPSLNTLEEMIATWFQGKLSGEFYYARPNNNCLLVYIANELKLEVELL